MPPPGSWNYRVVTVIPEIPEEIFQLIIKGSSRNLEDKMLLSRLYIAVMLFFLTATIGVGHNFYWIAKPTGVIALGSTFSTTQVLPLILLTIDAWKRQQETARAEAQQKQGNQKYVMKEVWLFLLGVNFWNVWGAGVLGSLIGYAARPTKTAQERPADDPLTSRPVTTPPHLRPACVPLTAQRTLQ